MATDTAPDLHGHSHGHNGNDQRPARVAVPIEDGTHREQRGVSIGANTFSILMGLGLGLWLYYYFWHAGKMPVWLGWFSAERIGMNVAWVIAMYLMLEPITSALTVFNRDRWRSAVLDISVSVMLVIEVCLALYDRNALALSGTRLEVAVLMLAVTVGMAVTGILITLIVNTRLIVPGGGHGH